MYLDIDIRYQQQPLLLLALFFPMQVYYPLLIIRFCYPFLLLPIFAVYGRKRSELVVIATLTAAMIIAVEETTVYRDHGNVGYKSSVSNPNYNLVIGASTVFSAALAILWIYASSLKFIILEQIMFGVIIVVFSGLWITDIAAKAVIGTSVMVNSTVMVLFLFELLSRTYIPRVRTALHISGRLLLYASMCIAFTTTINVNLKLYAAAKTSSYIVGSIGAALLVVSVEPYIILAT